MKTFKETSIGGCSKEELLQRLKTAGVQFNAYAETLFRHPDFSPNRAVLKVALVKVSLSDLGVNGACSYATILARAATMNLHPCPLNLGAFLRLEEFELLVGQYLTIASPSLGTDENEPTGFYVRDLDGIKWLRGYRVVGEADWPANNEFLFMK